MVLVDTSVWADLLNEYPSVEASAMHELLNSDAVIFTTGVIIQEVLQGIKERKKRTEIGNDFEAFAFISPSWETHIQAAEVFCYCRKKGITVRKSVDILIAALALEYDLEVLHKDRDFPAIAKLFPLKLYKKL